MKTTGFFRKLIRGWCTSGPLALCVLLPCTSFAGPHLELEAGAGGAVADAWAPVLSARVGLGWKHFIPSIRVLSVVGATPQYVPGGRYGIGGSGYRGTSVFGELRLRTEVSERLQLFVALGLGIGPWDVPLTREAWPESNASSITGPFPQLWAAPACEMRVGFLASLG
jgi:hypothetical protein